MGGAAPGRAVKPSTPNPPPPPPPAASGNWGSLSFGLRSTESGLQRAGAQVPSGQGEDQRKDSVFPSDWIPAPLLLSALGGPDMLSGCDVQ